MKNLRGTILFALAGAALFAGFYTLGQTSTPADLKHSGMMERGDKDKIKPSAVKDPTINNAAQMITEGHATFRFDTFGDEAFWGDALKLHDAIQGERFGGVGPGVSPRAASASGSRWMWRHCHANLSSNSNAAMWISMTSRSRSRF